MSHLTDQEIDGYRERKLDPAALLRATAHISECAECQRKVREMVDVGALVNVLSAHLSAEELQEYVDGASEPANRARIETHLRRCADCAQDIAELREFSRTRTRPPAWRSAMAAAAAVVLIAGGVMVWSRRAPAVLVALEDSGRQVTLDAGGRLHGIEGLSGNQADSVRSVLAGGSLAPPDLLRDLQPAGGTLLGPSEAPAFKLVGPVGTAVLSATPELKWTEWKPNATYIVTLRNLSSGRTISSLPLAAPEWTPSEPLQPGSAYTWQVAGTVGGLEEVIPRPPQPQAKFLVLDAAQAALLQRLPDSHLLRAIAYAQAGLLDDAEREARALQAENPGSSFAVRLSGQIESLHRR